MRFNIRIHDTKLHNETESARQNTGIFMYYIHISENGIREKHFA